MSEPQLISPMLDGFVMGDPISNHDGVRCCPAIQLETDKKYIVKIVSVPASQSKLDALLLAGAFSDRESALSYFQEMADSVISEAELLQRLSRSEGFVAYDSWQLVPMENDETGFDIYLLGAYRQTLENVLRDNALTHLGAVNLGLDLCSALSVARRFGYIYCNLRPTNIHICKENAYCIADLGFISLDSIPYASLPDKYHSDYTPPEISDAYSSLNPTMDTYAVGLILYQVYNGGLLPPVGMPLSAPKYADAAISEIILKACSLNPEERWQDPVQMGQALIAYLQGNSVNDTPIVPEVTEEATEEVEQPAIEDAEPTTEEVLAEVDEALEAAPPIIVSEPAQEELPAEETEDESEEPTDTEEALEESIEEEIVDEEPAVSAEEDAQEECADADAEAEIEAETDSEESTPLDDSSQILAQADKLIAHQLPDPVVVPEPIEVTLPVAEESAEEASDEAEAEEDPEVTEEAAAEAEKTAENESDAEECNDQSDPLPAPKKALKKWLVAVISLAAGLMLLAAGFLFYQNYYLQTIYGITLIGREDALTVSLQCNIPSEKLSVSCTDTYGNKIMQPVVSGIATFTDLQPGTNYKLEVCISGFHKLLGRTTENYTTVSKSIVSGLYAATGAEDGSVILSFSLQGPKSEQWAVKYYADDEQEKTVTFSGQMVTLNGLTVGKEYTFTIQPLKQLYLEGETTIKHTPSTIIYAQNIQILGFKDNALTVGWTTPENATVKQWTVRCYNDSGYNTTLTTTENTITFPDLDTTLAYNLEVIADGMTMGARTYLSANSVTIQDIRVDCSDGNNMQVAWDFEGTVPEGGWLLLYSLNGSADQNVVECAENSATITPLIPGAQYKLTIQPANGSTIFGGELQYKAPDAPVFDALSFKAEDIKFSMCVTPNKDKWDKDDVSKKDYKTTFAVGESASFVMRLSRNSGDLKDNIVTLYVIRDEAGNVISNKYESRIWDDMWYKKDGKLTIPFMPDQPGKYTVEIYFNGAYVTTQNFKIVA